MSSISLIVAIDEAGLIGKNNQLPWHLPADLKHFKQVTMGHPIIMGRKTFESIGKALPGRKNIVVSRQADYKTPEGVIKTSDIQTALEAAEPSAEAFIIGGSELFKSSMNLAEKIYLTVIHHQFEGDTWFPVPSREIWNWEKMGEHSADERNAWSCTFWLLRKK